jgi:NAD(P)-dependent dehydrogenase (short-subunit alcohol dehydrogenase family)
VISLGVCPAGAEARQAREGISVAQAQANRDAGIPLGRQADPLEIADAFVYLASPVAAYITGTWLDINSGVILR